MIKDTHSFDTSLFERYDPKLAQDVRKTCLDLGFEGLSNIKLPGIAALTFVNKKGATYNAIVDFILMHDRSKEEKYLNTHYKVLEEYVVQSKTYPIFMKRIKFVNTDFETKANKRINKVYYGIFKTPVYGG